MALVARYRVALVVALLLLASLWTSGCGGVCGSLADFMRQVPDQATAFSYRNPRGLQNDADLHPLLDRWKAVREAQLSELGVASSTVDRFFEFYVGNQAAFLVVGEYKRDEVRANLKDMGYDEKDFKFVEVWESPGGLKWLAITADSLIGGAKELVKESINVIKGEMSLYDAEDAKDIADRLPCALMVDFADFAPGTARYANLNAMGESFEKHDSETLRVTQVYKFTDPDSADSAAADVAEDVDEYYNRVEFRQNGSFVTVSAVVPIEDLI